EPGREPLVRCEVMGSVGFGRDRGSAGTNQDEAEAPAGGVFRVPVWPGLDRRGSAPLRGGGETPLEGSRRQASRQARPGRREGLTGEGELPPQGGLPPAQDGALVLRGGDQERGLGPV